MTDIFQTYNKDTGIPIIGAGSGLVDIPTTYESGLLYEVEKPFTPFIINSTKFHETKHPIIQSTSGIVSGLSGNGKPTDIYIEQTPDFVKSFNKDMMSNYMLDLQQNTYADGTRLGYLDPSKTHTHSAVIGLHSQEKMPMIEPLDYLNIYRPRSSIDTGSQGSASELIPMYEEIGLVSGRIPITGGIDESYQKTVDDFKVEPEDTFREAKRVDKERTDDMNNMLKQITSINKGDDEKSDIMDDFITPPKVSKAPKTPLKLKLDTIPEKKPKAEKPKKAKADEPTKASSSDFQTAISRGALMERSKTQLGDIIEGYNKANNTNLKYKSKTKAERIELILKSVYGDK